MNIFDNFDDYDEFEGPEPGFNADEYISRVNL